MGIQTGISTQNLDPAAAVSHLLGNRALTADVANTVRISVSDLASLMLADGPLSTALAGVSGGFLVYTSVAALYADLAHGEGTGAWVTGASSGIYRKSGASGSGSWVRTLDLPYSLINAVDAGAGTANSIIITSSLPISEGALVAFTAARTMNGAATIQINGAAAIPIHTVVGTDIVTGGIQASMLVVGRFAAAEFRLLSDMSNAAAIAAAQSRMDGLQGEIDNRYTKTETDTRIQAVVGVAPAALDTLQEIGAQMAGDESAVASLTAVVSTKLNASDLPAGVRGVLLTGLSIATNAVISATDTVLGALGKLQAQISTKVTSGGDLGAGATVPTPGTSDTSTKVANTQWVADRLVSISSGVTTWMDQSGILDAAKVVAGINAAFADAILGLKQLRVITTAYPKIVWNATSNSAGQRKAQIYLDLGGSVRIDALLDDETAATNLFLTTKEGMVIAPGGLKTTKCIHLEDATDANGVLEAGVYDGNNIANSPAGLTGWGYLQVTRHSQSSDYAMQRYTLLSTTTGSLGNLTVSWVRKRIAGTWSAWAPVGGIITPQHYGGVGDGASDDTTPLSAAMNSGFQVRLHGKFLITSAITTSLAGRNGLKIEGSGSTAEILCSTATARVVIGDIDPDNPWGGNIDQVILRDFFIVPMVTTTVDILTVSAADGDMGSSSPGLVCENVHILPANTSVGTSGANFRFHNMRNGVITGCSGAGVYGAYAGIIFHITAGVSSAPVELKFTFNNGAHADTMFLLERSDGSASNDDWQGVSICDNDGLALNRGVYADGGPDAFSEWLKVVGNTFYYRVIGIWAPNVRRPIISDNDLLAFDAQPTCQGVNTDVSGGSSQYGKVRGNTVDFTACTSPTKIGIYVQSGGTSVSRTHVTDNMVISATTAYSLSATAYTNNNQSV